MAPPDKCSKANQIKEAMSGNSVASLQFSTPMPTTAGTVTPRRAFTMIEQSGRRDSDQ